MYHASPRNQGYGDAGKRVGPGAGSDAGAASPQADRGSATPLLSHTNGGCLMTKVLLSPGEALYNKSSVSFPVLTVFFALPLDSDE